MARKIPFLGLPFDALTMEQVLGAIDGFIAERRPRKIFCPNVSLLTMARGDPKLRRVYETCDLLPIDGMGIYYASRLVTPAFPDSCSAVSIAMRLLERSASKNYRFYFLGTRPEVLERAVVNVRRQFPGANIVGWHHGFFTEESEPEIAGKIAAARPDILLLGMSSPKKEFFVHRNLGRMGVPVCLGVGGTLDILAGEYSLAPEWVRRAALEWVYRLVQEPSRLWKRYLATNTQFLILLILEIFHRMFYRSTNPTESGAGK